MLDALNIIKDFAQRAHNGQVRKYTNEPYIIHPIRVMEMCRPYTENIAVLAAALLHDVLEDTAVNREALGDFLLSELSYPMASATLNIVEELTDIYTKSNFPDLNRKTRKLKEMQRLTLTSADAQTIKYADIIDNAEITTQDPDFATIYLRECKQLLENMTKGNPELRKSAMKKITESLISLKRISGLRLKLHH